VNAYFGSQTRIVGAKAIGKSLSVSQATVYSWSKRSNSPIPLYRTEDCRLWCKKQDVEDYWGKSEMVCGPNDEYQKAATQAVQNALIKRRD
jgi:hypothetical protein